MFAFFLALCYNFNERYGDEMNKLKQIFGNKKLLITIGGSVIGIIVLILLIVTLIKFLNRKITYAALEDQLSTATQKYLNDHPEYFPTMESPSFTLTSDTLVNEKYIKKEIGKLVKDTCSAEVEVLYKNDSYQIKPALHCTKYETQLLFDQVLLDNPVVTDASGLYDVNEKLVFRGLQNNNYIEFNKKLWRIVKMDPTDSTIYITLENLKDAPMDVWDNNYNTTEESRHGINNYDMSVVYQTLSNIYLNEFSNVKSAMVPMDMCVGKRSEAESVNDSSIECSNVMQEKKYIGLLPLYDYINASLDYQCRSASSRACANYNYLVNKVGKWWTLTADGSRGTKVYGVNYTGAITSDFADSKKYIRYVVAIDGTLIYSKGNGTQENPYVFK